MKRFVHGNLWLLVTCALAISGLTSQAHGPLSELIVTVTDQLKADPNNAKLYLERSDLYRRHQEWEAAESDLANAAAHDASLPEIKLTRAALLLDRGKAQEAEKEVTSFLEKSPSNISGLWLRSKCREALGQHAEAATDLDLMLKSITEPWPDVYLDRAILWQKAGTEHFEHALKGLEDGIAKCGPLLTLEKVAMELEIALHRNDAAQKRIDGVLTQFPRNIDWLEMKARLLQTMGKKPEAEQVCKAALSILESLPSQRRSAPAIQAMEKNLRELLGNNKAEDQNATAPQN